MKNRNLFALVDMESNRAYVLFESGMGSYFNTLKYHTDRLRVENTGVTTHRTEKGIITSMTIYTENDVIYYLITDWPENISLDEAYELIK